MQVARTSQKDTQLNKYNRIIPFIPLIKFDTTLATTITSEEINSPLTLDSELKPLELILNIKNCNISIFALGIIPHLFYNIHSSLDQHKPGKIIISDFSDTIFQPYAARLDTRCSTQYKLNQKGLLYIPSSKIENGVIQSIDDFKVIPYKSKNLKFK